MNDLISIIIPVYNRQALIAECLNSVFAQTHQNWETIIIDDGSTDETVEIVKRRMEQDSRIRLICNQHQGVSAARNAGLDAARGDFVFFLDSDDVIHPNLLEYLVANMNGSAASIGCCYLTIVPESKWHLVPGRIAKSPRTNTAIHKTWQEAMNDMFYHYTSTPLSGVGSIIVRRSLVGETRFHPELTVGEDFFFNYQNIIKKPDVSILDQKWYYARRHSQDSGQQPILRMTLSRLLRRQLIWESEAQQGRRELVRHQKASALAAYLQAIRTVDKNDTVILQSWMKAHRSDIRPDLRQKNKLMFFLGVNFPRLYVFLMKNKHASNDK